MNKCAIWLLFLLMSIAGHTTVCPDPETSSLKWGVPPDPWVVNPFSKNPPQGDVNTQFVRAYVLVAGAYADGVACVYSNSLGEYSIWWNVLTKLPSRTDVYWINALGGYLCTAGLQECQFFVAH